MPDSLKRILTPLASLKLTVVLLMLAMLLVYAGTGAQMDAGVIDVQHRYFHSLFCWIPIHTLLLQQPAPGKHVIGGDLPMLGGYALGSLLLLNLLAAHAVRFKMTWKRTGIILIHVGLILLIVGEAITSVYQVESRMVLNIGSAANWTTDIRNFELAVTDTSNPDHDQVTTIRPALLKQGETIRDSRLPFDLRIDEFEPNSMVMTPKEAPVVAAQHAKATAGEAVGIGLIPQERRNGVGEDASAIDFPSAYVTVLAKDGKDLGTYLLSSYFTDMVEDPEVSKLEHQTVEVNGKPYEICLRFKRLYKPYTVRLLNFEHKRYTGTNIPKDFASTIRLTDPSEGVDREVRVWMNHPLRYHGETFYQSGFGRNDKSSTLQVVSNPGWLMPYIACAIGALGMVIHFGMTLLKFLDKRATKVWAPHGHPEPKHKDGRGAVKVAPGPEEMDWRGWAIPGLATVVMAITLIAGCTSVKSDGPYNVTAWSRLPVSFEGRVQPLDTVARNALKILSNYETFYPERTREKAGPARPAAEWLFDVVNDPEKAAGYKVIRIDAPDVKSLFTKDSLQEYFSPAEIFARWQDFLEQTFKAQNKHAEAQKNGKATTSKDDDYARNLGVLWDKIKLYIILGGEPNARHQPLVTLTNAALKSKLDLPADKALYTMDDIIQHAQTLKTDLPEALNTPRDKRTTYQQAMVDLARQLDLDEGVNQQIFKDAEESGRLHPIPPSGANADWMTLIQAADAAESDVDHPPFGFQNWRSLYGDYAEKKAGDFNESVAIYTASLQTKFPVEMEKTRFEASYNQFAPFFQARVLYVIAFILVCLTWLFPSERTATGVFRWLPFYRIAIALILLALAVHTGGLVARIYISGRPPVTNLASSAIFIAWAVVVFSIGLEYLFRNSIGLLTACVAGFVSLFIADKLALEGDTMKVLVAVLDTNVWLATHVVCITLGYASTFLAGLLGIVYVFRAFFDSSFDKHASRELTRMIYGIVCFAMLFSFVGTILGGIWADQSWGRFWGWDPKENGAVLIVLANALLLHARWGGVIRERGIALFAIFGNIVTAWSWFGTNMLGIGLHSYGFMPRALFWLLIFVSSQVALIIVGLLPRHFWANRELSAS